jgi:hypothetical protein
MIRSVGATRTAYFLSCSLAAALAGCSIGTGIEADSRAGLSCVDDSPECISRRQTTLRHLVEDKDRVWVKEPATTEAYASGVRLFAYKKQKTVLSCDELAHGKREADAARTALKSGTSKLTPAQVSRGTMLAAEVAKELQVEMGRRCKKG